MEINTNSEYNIFTLTIEPQVNQLNNINSI